MAITKIIAVRNHLNRAMQYVSNPKKTALEKEFNYVSDGSKTQAQLYCDVINCRSVETAVSEMEQTKHQFAKTDGILAYHIIQSFAPGEDKLTPEIAHEIGLEFSRRCFGTDYQVIVTTHLDRAHLHNHILVNSVGCFNGKKYHSNRASYYKELRATSDALCKEYGLSIITPARTGKDYTEAAAEYEGKATVRGTIRKDVDIALARSIDWNTFVFSLKQMGYTVSYGHNIKYATIQPRNGKRRIRFKSLGEGYSEDELRQKLSCQHYVPGKTIKPYYFKSPKKYRYRGSFAKRTPHKYKGFMALYYHYVCMFRKSQKKHSYSKTRYLLRDDLVKFDRYVNQAKFIWENNIETLDQVTDFEKKAQLKIDELSAQRARLYRHRSNSRNGMNKGDLTDAIKSCTEQIQQYRREIFLCQSISEDAEHINQQMNEIKRQQLAEHQKRKEQSRNEYRR